MCIRMCAVTKVCHIRGIYVATRYEFSSVLTFCALYVQCHEYLSFIIFNCLVHLIAQRYASQLELK